MKLLGIDTATEACTVALWLNGEIRSRFEVAPQGHAALVLPMAEGLLAAAGLRPAGLDGVVVGRGPGSFTGVRIGIGVAQGIAFAADLPVVPVSTLAVIAQDALSESTVGRVLVALDARMHEVYWGWFERGPDDLVKAMGGEHVSPPASVEPAGGGDWLGAGHGWQAYRDELARAVGSPAGVQADRLPHGEDLVRLGAAAFEAGGTVAPEEAVPVYLRDRVADERARQR